MAITLETDDAFNCFLCSFFGGMLVTCDNDTIRKKASSNFRRLYKLLPNDEKISVQKALTLLNQDPEKYLGKGFRFFNDLTDE